MNKIIYRLRNIYYLSLLVLITPCISSAQGVSTSKYPEIGQPCPDFKLTDVRYYKNKTAVLNDFKGKWLVLDFWNRYCATCLASQPHIDSLQKLFEKEVQFLLVGYSGSKYRGSSDYDAIVSLYERSKERNNLRLSIAFDSTVSEQFDIGPTPYIIVIDPKGTVRAISYKISEQNIRDMMAGREVELPKAYRRKEAKERLKNRNAPTT